MIDAENTQSDEIAARDKAERITTARQHLAFQRARRERTEKLLQHAREKFGELKPGMAAEKLVIRGFEHELATYQAEILRAEIVAEFEESEK